MSVGKCKAAIDCVGFKCQLDGIVDLILADEITDDAAIDAFNEMKEGFQQRVDRWIKRYVDFDNP